MPVAVLGDGGGASGDAHMDGHVKLDELRVPQEGGARLGLLELPGGTTVRGNAHFVLVDNGSFAFGVVVFLRATSASMGGGAARARWVI